MRQPLESYGLIFTLLICACAPEAARADWPVNGVPISTYGGAENSPHLAPDGDGGVFAAWWSGYSTYAERITGAGEYAEAWPGVGLLVPPGGGIQADHNSVYAKAIARDGKGGAYVALFASQACWAECGAGPGQYYIQRLTSAGT